MNDAVRTESGLRERWLYASGFARMRVCTSGCLDGVEITSMRKIAAFGDGVERRKKKRNIGARRRR